jgi:hypothetical protein
MQIRLSSGQWLQEALKEIVRSGLPILFLFISILYFNTDKADYNPPQWQAHHGDGGDYRYLGELFWGLPHRLETYEPNFSTHWAFFLDHVPFRQIGVGTFYVLFISLFYRHASITTQLAAAAFWLPVILTGLMAISYLFFYTACRKVWGWKLSLAAFVCLLFPPRFWALNGELLTEPFLRICLVNILALLVLFQTERLVGLKIALVFLFIIFAAQVRSQWLAYAFFLLPFLILFLIARKHYRLIWGSLGLTLLVPLSLYAVNLIGWGYPAITTCTGFHINLKTDGKLMEYIAARIDRQRAAHPAVKIRTPVYLQDTGLMEPWWHFNFPLPTQSDLPTVHALQNDYLLLDKYTSAYLLADWPNRILIPLIDGCFMLTNFTPDVAGDGDYYPPLFFYRLIDGLLFIIL